MIPRPARSRVLFLGFSLAILTAWGQVLPARGDDASKLAVIHEMFTVTHVDTLMQQTMQQVLAMQKAQVDKSGAFESNKEAHDEVFERLSQLMTDRMSWEKLKPMMTKLYADTFTEEELAAVVAFYKTPAGQALLAKLPAVMAGAMKISQEQMTDLMPEVQKIVKEAMARHPSPAGENSPEHP